MNLRTFDHVSFDLDGTLVDSFPVMRQTWGHVSEQFKLGKTFASYEKHIGLPFNDILRSLGIDRDRSEIKQAYFDYAASLSDQVKPYDGALELIKNLRAQGKLVSIITSKNRRNSILLLEKHGLSVDVLVTADDVEFGKPSKDSYLEACRQLDLSPSDCRAIYFGDTLNDLIFALNAKMDYCHCVFGVSEPHPNLLPRPNLIRAWTEVHV